MRHLDLFSGIGGFSLAASLVWGRKHEVVAFCEIDGFCQKVLAKHWPGVPIVPDIRDVKGSDYADVDLVTGGFPCQPFSCAGRRKGANDARHLWPEMLRVVREAAPRHVLAENVPGLLTLESGMVFDRVCADLENAGYEVLSFVIPACAVNAPHRRDRAWIVAHAQKRGQSMLRGAQGKSGFGVLDDEGSLVHSYGGRRQAGSMVGERVPGGARIGRNAADNQSETQVPDSGNVAHSDIGHERIGLCAGKPERERRGRFADDGGASSPAGSSPKPAVRNGPGFWSDAEWMLGRDGKWRRTKPGLRLLAHGIPERVDKLRGLGNAIVPEVAVVIMRSLKEAGLDND